MDYSFGTLKEIEREGSLWCAWVFFGCIDGDLCSQLLGQLQLVVSHVDGDRRHAHALGILEPYVAKASHSKDHTPLAWLCLCLLEAFVGILLDQIKIFGGFIKRTQGERTFVCGQSCTEERRSLNVVHALRKHSHIALWGHNILSIP